MSKVTTNEGIKVGDIFYMSWGYDQTNNSFYRIKSLRGKTQVVIQAVSLKVSEYDGEGYSPMAADITYDKNNYSIKERDVFVDDNEKGRVLYVKEDYDGKGKHMCINYHSLRPYRGQKLYESWYA